MSQSDHPEQPVCPLPKATGQAGLQILRRLAATRSPLVALEMMQQHVGNLFQIQAPGFTPAVMAGPEYNRQLLLTDRASYLWRTETDPVTELLRRGVLVLDGEEHDRVRACMEPTMLRRPTLAHVDTMVGSTDWIVDQWQDGGTYDMLVEMRKIALLILIGTLFGVDFRPDLQRMWDPILRAIDTISPGLWILSPKLPRRRYPKELAALDAYLYDLIGRRRTHARPARRPAHPPGAVARHGRRPDPRPAADDADRRPRHQHRPLRLDALPPGRTPGRHAPRPRGGRHRSRYAEPAAPRRPPTISTGCTTWTW